LKNTNKLLHYFCNKSGCYENPNLNALKLGQVYNTDTLYGEKYIFFHSTK